MRQISDFLSARAQGVARHLVWVASAGASGVQWTDGQIVTLGRGSTIVRTASVTTPSEPQPVTLVPLERFEQGGWIVVAARNPDGAMVTASGLLGGVAAARCGTEDVRRLLFNVPLESAYAGAGVFGMSGMLIGLVVRCGDTWMAITHDSVTRLLQQQYGPEAVVWLEFGVLTRKPSAEEQKILRLPPDGLFVAEVRRASTAANMGLRPGDVVLLDRPEDLLGDQAEINVIRNGRRIALSTNPPYSFERQDEGAVLTSVQPGTRVANAGLQPGDRLLNPAALDSRRPVWLVYRRDDREIGVLLP
jgi:S1-C subfamily serine protease